jgi:uncharacterized protein YqgC (DUF456 family)
MTLIAVIVGLLFVAGLVGSVLPWLPGPLFILVGALLWAIATDFQSLGIGRLVVLTALTVLSTVLGFVAGAVGARGYGGSRWSMIGASAGAIVGVFFGPLGMIVGCVLGAIAGELLRGADLRGSIRSGIGALIGFLAGLAADLVVSLTMIGLFLFWVW